MCRVFNVARLPPVIFICSVKLNVLMILNGGTRGTMGRREFKGRFTADRWASLGNCARKQYYSIRMWCRIKLLLCVVSVVVPPGFAASWSFRLSRNSADVVGNYSNTFRPETQVFFIRPYKNRAFLWSVSNQFEKRKKKRNIFTPSTRERSSHF